RFIFDFAASYAVARAWLLLVGPSAKNGCCFRTDVDVWHSAHCSTSSGCTVAPNRNGSGGKLLLASGSRNCGGSSSIWRAPPSTRLPAQFVIPLSRMSAHAPALCSQQL